MIFFVLTLASLFAACGQLLFKSGASGAVALPDFINLRVFAGLVLYGASTLLWIWSLSRAPLVVVYPFTVLTFLLVYCGAVWFYGERLSAGGMLGAVCVLAGLLIIITQSS